MKIKTKCLNKSIKATGNSHVAFLRGWLPPRLISIVMSKEKRYFLPKTKSDRLWLALIVVPPGILLIYRVFSSILSYDGRYHGVLESGPECTLLEFIFSELTSTFFLPAMVVITLYWIAAVGVIYFGVRIFKRISKREETPT
jgi:hypothetical protein